MGGFLDRPKTDKDTESGDGNGLWYGVASMQGWRCEMEDAHHALIGLPHNLSNWSFFAVFDGHAGSKVSAHCASNLLNSIMADDEFLNYANQLSSASTTTSTSPSHLDRGGGGGGGGLMSTGDPQGPADASSQATTNSESLSESNQSQQPAALNNINTKSSTTTAVVPELTPEEAQLVKRAIHDGFLRLDEKMKNLPEVESGEDKSGSTAVAALISPSHIWIANCGDSRAVLSQRGGRLLATEDHKPVNPQEKERIQNAGGSVMIQRVNGSLAVSRALGDYEYKNVAGKGPCEQLVSPEPEIHVHVRNEDEDEFIIIACDGVWDVMQNDELCDFIRHQLTCTSDLRLICSSIIDTCLHKGSRDNMSVVLVTFPGAPKMSPERQAKEIALNKNIELRIEEILKENSSTTLYALNRALLMEFAEDLPPGGGIDSKRQIINEVYERLTGNKNSNGSEPSTPAASSIVNIVYETMETLRNRSSGGMAAASSLSSSTTSSVSDGTTSEASTSHLSDSPWPSFKTCSRTSTAPGGGNDKVDDDTMTSSSESAATSEPTPVFMELSSTPPTDTSPLASEVISAASTLSSAATTTIATDEPIGLNEDCVRDASASDQMMSTSPPTSSPACSPTPPLSSTSQESASGSESVPQSSTASSTSIPATSAVVN